MKPGQWWSAPTEHDRRLMYYRCMREIYEFTAQESLRRTREMFQLLGGQFDLMAAFKQGVKS